MARSGRGTPYQFLQPLALLTLISCVLVLVASLPLEADRSHLKVVEAKGAIVGNCSQTSRLLYSETVIVLKEASSLVRGTVQINVGNAMSIDCVQVVAKSEHDRQALKGHQLLGPQAVEISIVEEHEHQTPALEYTLHLYGSYDPRKNAKAK